MRCCGWTGSTPTHLGRPVELSVSHFLPEQYLPRHAASLRLGGRWNGPTSPAVAPIVMPEAQVLKFGVLVFLDESLTDIPGQFRWLENRGFDQVLVPDHSADLRNRGGPWFDSWSLLPIAVHTTDRIRIGTLVSNPVLRPAADSPAKPDPRPPLGWTVGPGDRRRHLRLGSSRGRRVTWSPRELAGRFADYTSSTASSAAQANLSPTKVSGFRLVTSRHRRAQSSSRAHHHHRRPFAHRASGQRRTRRCLEHARPDRQRSRRDSRNHCPTEQTSR